jgi:hypothetical protein
VEGDDDYDEDGGDDDNTLSGAGTFISVLGICDILVRIRIPGSVSLTPDPTPFFNDFKDAKKMCFFHIFSYNLPTGTLSSVLKI